LLHFIPALIVLAALSVFTRARLVALLMAIMLIFTAGINNVLQVNKAISFVNQQIPQSSQQQFFRSTVK
jgi:cell division protein FtsL